MDYYDHNARSNDVIFDIQYIRPTIVFVVIENITSILACFIIYWIINRLNNNLLFVLWTILSVWVLLDVVNKYNRTIIIENNRFVIRTGFWIYTINYIPIGQVKAVIKRQTLLGKILGYMCVKLQNENGDSILFLNGIPESDLPLMIRKCISDSENRLANIINIVDVVDV